MKRIITISILLFCSLAGLLAVNVTPYYDPFDSMDDVFTSPARLVEESGVTHFAFDVEAFSGIDLLAYLSNPAFLEEFSDHLYRYYRNADLSFWSEGAYSEFRNAFSFDDSDNLPQRPVDDLTLAQMQAYLDDSFSRRFDSAQKASAVLSASGSSTAAAAFSDDVLYSDLNLSLGFRGGAVYGNGFGWQIESNMGFIGNRNMLEDRMNLLAVDVRADVGYAIHLFSDRFSIGGSLELLAAMNNYISNHNFLGARFNDDVVSMFSENFKFGLGFGVDFGSMYRHNEELAFTLDLVNLVSLRKYYDLELTDFVDYNGFDEDEAVYYQPMDLVLRAIWDSGPYHIMVEFSNVIDQIFWMKEIDGYRYDFFSIPKFSFAYDINEDLSIRTRLGFSRLSFGLDYKSFSIEVSSALDEFGFGIKAGMRF